MCFSMVDLVSYEDVYHKWLPEIRHHCPDVPILLVGLQKDRCSDPETIQKLRGQYWSSAPLTTLDGIEMAERIGAIKFMECSSFLGEGVDEVFREAAVGALSKC